MTWALESAEPKVSSGLLPSISANQNDRVALSKFIQSESSAVLPPITMADALRADTVCTVAALSPRGRFHTDTIATRPRTILDGSEKRGLSGETVRGGSPRNTWRYCEVPVAVNDVRCGL
ncbi:hypothetical protein Vretifemale_10051 [Volvox reticuliferus]|nr:hypothetical protein Vretifemale_10051 [Volvox reticuliferus]